MYHKFMNQESRNVYLPLVFCLAGAISVHLVLASRPRAVQMIAKTNSLNKISTYMLNLHLHHVHSQFNVFS